MNYYEIRIKGKDDSITTLFYPTFKGSSSAKRHASIMADRLGRWKYIDIWYVNESADVRDYVSGRGKADIWVNYE